MREQQQHNLQRIRADQKLEQRHKEQLELQTKLSESIAAFSEVLRSFGDMMSKLQNTLSALTNKQDPDYTESFTKLFNSNEKMAEHIEKLNIAPIVNIPAPIVNVEPVLINEDKLAKYTRVNSQIDPEGIYHGFVDSDSNWFIRLETEVNGLRQASRFAVGKGKLATNWSKRKSLDYKPYDQVEIA